MKLPIAGIAWHKGLWMKFGADVGLIDERCLVRFQLQQINGLQRLYAFVCLSLYLYPNSRPKSTSESSTRNQFSNPYSTGPYGIPLYSTPNCILQINVGRHDFLLNKKTCPFAGQEDMSSCKMTCILVQ